MLIGRMVHTADLSRPTIGGTRAREEGRLPSRPSTLAADRATEPLHNRRLTYAGRRSMSYVLVLDRSNRRPRQSLRPTVSKRTVMAF